MEYETRVCKKHGEQKFIVRKGNSARCQKCQIADVATRRLKVKKLLIARAGGKCVRCGYDKCLAALEFHHLNRSEKVFNLGDKYTWNPEKLWEEAKKCILVCANCHREIEQEYNAG